MTENQITTLPAEVEQIAKTVSVEKRNEVQSVLNYVFAGVEKMKKQLETVVVKDETDKTNMKLANTIRLGVRQTRLDAEKTFDAKRAEVQQQMLSYKTEDALWLKAKQVMQLLTKEIEENARWKEETAKRAELERAEMKVQQRLNEVSKYAEIGRHEIEFMADATFEAFLSSLKQKHEAKIEAEKEAERLRIEAEKEAEAERERIKAENERLKKEAEAKEQQLAIERAEAARKQAEMEAQAKKEAEAKAKIQAELKAKQEAELKAKQDEEARIEAELKKGDAAKIIDLVSELESIKTKYAFKSKRNQALFTDVCVLIDKVTVFIETKTASCKQL